MVLLMENDSSMGSDLSDDIDDWDSSDPSIVADTDFMVNIEGFAGPLDLLLLMARTQKVDLSQISILELSDQYLSFIERVRSLRLELAGDYLVMAAWLAYLKSKLLLYVPDDDDVDAAEMARQLAFRLRRLEAMRQASEDLKSRDRLGITIFARGDGEPMTVHTKSVYSAQIYDLLSAYGDIQAAKQLSNITISPRKVFSLMEARETLVRFIGKTADWISLDRILRPWFREYGADLLASSFAASLEMVREGVLELKQSENFAPLYVRRVISDSDISVSNSSSSSAG